MSEALVMIMFMIMMVMIIIVVMNSVVASLTNE